MKFDMFYNRLRLLHFFLEQSSECCCSLHILTAFVCAQARNQGVLSAHTRTERPDRISHLCASLRHHGTDCCQKWILFWH